MYPCRRRLLALCVAAAVLHAGGALAQIDFTELVFGASNVQATTGNGALTAGISRDGDVTVLSWPSPSYHDQLHYLSANGPGARARPLMGALPGMGAMSGLAYTAADGAAKQTSFFRDAAWTRRVTFSAPATTVVVTTFTRADLGLTVVQRDFVTRTNDVLVRRYEVRRAPTSPVTGAWLLAYANLSPTLSRVEQVPLADFLSDHYGDFLAAWDRQRGAIVHFHPRNTGVADTVFGLVNPVRREFGLLGELLRAPAIDESRLEAVLASLDQAYEDGVYAALSSVPAPDQFQVGEDATDTCAAIDGWAAGIEDLAARLPEGALPAAASAAGLARCGQKQPVADVRAAEGWLYRPEDALEDAADGELSGSRLAGAQVNTALRVPLAFVDGSASATVYVAFGRTAGFAFTALDLARSADPAVLQAEVEAADRAFVAGLVLPTRASAGLREFCVRALLNVRVGTDRRTSAIIASVSRQPSYQLDWPRDGSFFNAALDIAGQHELVTKRLDFYASVMRRERTPAVPLVNAEVPGWPDCSECKDYPPSSWEMNYYADGPIGGNLRLEIDNTALLVWSFVNHAGYLEAPARAEYLERVWPTVKAAAVFLAGWRDPANGLVWPANEDDNAPFTQGLQGAGTVFGALRAAAMMARAMGDEVSARAWAERAGELRRAALRLMFIEGVGFQDQPLAGSILPVGGASSWLAWPTHFLPYSDPRLQEQLRRNLRAHIALVRGEGEGGAYLTKAAVSGALALPPGPDRDLAIEIAESLASDDADTRTIGEVFVNAGGRRVNAVATPHLWAGILVYLTAMAYEAPERFDRYEAVLPPVTIPEPPPPGRAGGGGSCGCGAAAGGAGGALWIALLGASRLRRRLRL